LNQLIFKALADKQVHLAGQYGTISPTL